MATLDRRQVRQLLREADSRMMELRKQHGGQGPSRTVLCRSCAKDCEWTGEEWLHVLDRTAVCDNLLGTVDYQRS